MGNKGGLRRSHRLKAQKDAKAVWSKIPYELLLRVLSLVSLVDRLVNVAAVCRSWRAAVSDPILSESKVDISECSRELSHLPVARKRAILRLAFVRGINVGLGSLKTIVFDFSYQVRDCELLYAASRCSNVQQLVLPCISENTTMKGLSKAFRSWTQLDSLVLGWKFGKLSMLEIAGRNCPNLKVLSICCPTLHLHMAAAIVSGMPRLKVLNMHCSFFNNAMGSAMDTLKCGSLEEFSITINENHVTKYRRLISPAHLAIHTGYYTEESQAEEFPMHHVVCSHRR